MQTISIIGAGRIGGSFALALSAKGYLIKKLFIRDPGSVPDFATNISPLPEICLPDDFDTIDEDLVFITTQDTQIRAVDKLLGPSLRNSSTKVFHTSGSLSSGVMEHVSANGNPVGSIHPLASISEPLTGVERLKGAYFCIEGDAEVSPAANQIVSALGGYPFSIETDKKPLYHAAAVTACGHLVATFDVAVQMLKECGIEEANSKEILLPLVESTVENLKSQTVADALTGTFARGDASTLEDHVNAMIEHSTLDKLRIYLRLGARSLELARGQGLDEDRILKTEKAIAEAVTQLEKLTKDDGISV